MTIPLLIELEIQKKVMGGLQWFWKDEKVGKQSKYLTFLAIPINLLLWVCKIWILKTSLLASFEVFLHCSIRNVLRINILQAQDQKLENRKLSTHF